VIDAILAWLIWADMTINDNWLGGRFETISGRLYRRQATKDCAGCRWICGLLDRIDPGHCRKAYFNDRIRNPSLPWI
jgi:hypothetical protein